jgi:hypothetical protein
MFFLLIPFAIIIGATFIYLIVSFFKKNINSNTALFSFSIIPIFVLTQLLSGYSVDKIQRNRSENIINEIQEIRKITGAYPVNYRSPLGIDYELSKDKNSFVLSYSRGFMVTEKYDSKNDEWKDYGWND